jgi:putative ABC transport system substrate-binding protein
MRRRDFIKIIAGSAAAWPFAAHAQQPERVQRIGVLMPLATDDPEARSRLSTFKQALQALGWIDGRNVHIDSRLSAANPADTRKYAAERLTSSWLVAARFCLRCSRQHRLCRSYSQSFPIHWVPASSRVCRGRAVTPPAL